MMIPIRSKHPVFFIANKTTAILSLLISLCSVLPSLHAQRKASNGPSLPTEKLSQQYFGADAPWFLHNIPFLEIDDPEIQQIYYYRWKLYRSHLREIGPEGITVTEFLDNVPWARQPYTDLNDSASFHLSEGRWLRDSSVVDSLIDHLYTGGGNDRHFSEAIAAATWGTTLVTGDPAPAIRHLDTMQYIFNEWSDHLDRSRNLYWVEPIADATEYTISSIDSSGAGFTDHPSTNDFANGFTRGFAFRPSINSYQYANALAIAHIAALDGKPEVAVEYTQRADALRSAVLAELWNPALHHFTDRYQRSTEYVTEGDFIRGRELVGYVPWAYELPQRDALSTADYAQAWQHALLPTELGGTYGLRTVEPSYPRYLTQYRYDQPTGRQECQWNGPSWPFQTSQALTGLANLLNDYKQSVATRTDYLRLLRQYTHQHFLAPGHPDLQEDYNPDTGSPIVGLPRSHHYNHSTYVDLLLNGLIGIRPRSDSILEINPLLPVDTSPNTRPIRYFALQGVLYHGHEISIVFDYDGKHYHMGPGLSVFVDGLRATGPAPLSRLLINLSNFVANPIAHDSVPVDLAVNVGVPGWPAAAASSSSKPGSPAEAIDGRLWFFSENPNGWSPAKDNANAITWYSVDFGQGRKLSRADLYFFGDGDLYQAPAGYIIQYATKDGWRDVIQQRHVPQTPVAGGLNRVTFPPIVSTRLRIVFQRPTAPANLRLVEFKVFDR